MNVKPNLFAGCALRALSQATSPTDLNAARYARVKRLAPRFSALLSAAFYPFTATAQVGPIPVAPPVFQSVDENGVDIRTGHLVQTLASIEIGPRGRGGVGYNWGTDNSAQREVFGYVVFEGGATYSVTIGGSAEKFTLAGTLGSGTFSSDQGTGATLTYNATTDIYTYTRSDGTVATFTGNLIPGAPISNFEKIKTLTYPTGEVLTYYYVDKSYTFAGTPVQEYDVQAVASSLGYQLRIGYTADVSGWSYVSSAVVFNMATETCDPAAASCTLTGSWPSLTYNRATGDITDSTGRTVRYTVPTPTTAQITYPSGRQLNYSFSGQTVASVTDGKGTWSYSHPGDPYAIVTLAFRPDFPVPRQYQFSPTNGRLMWERTELIQTSYTYDAKDRVATVTVGPTAGGAVRQTNYTYDARGNVTEVRQISETPGSPADIVTQAGYPSTCAAQKTCNQPDYTIDANGQQTDYAYDAAHGGVTSVTLPAAPGGIRPQTRYAYTALSANYRDGTGTMIAGALAYRVTAVSQCATTASCAGTADEVKTSVTYGANDALLPVSVTSGSGDGLLAATTATAYYPTGDVKTVDGPLAGTADTARAYYDAAGRPTGSIGPDPDGAGPLLRRATRTTYNGDGQVSLTEAGTATGIGDGGMASFVPLQQVATDYDAQGRVLKERRLVAGVTDSVVQHSYTNGGLPECVAVRMNPATFGSLPASACTPATAGSYGPDKIARTAYNGYYQPTSVTSAAGTPLEAAEVTDTYTTMGQLATMTDGEGNTTTNEYDGHGRLIKTRYPVATKGANASSTTDYELLNYDPNGNITSHQLRDGTTIGFAYDNLNRLSTKNLPGSEPDVGYTYDLLGRMTGASQTGNALTFSYDALGRNLTQGGPLGTVSYAYDAAGQRIRMTWPDAFYVTYDHLVTGETSAIRENGAASGIGVLASFAYDDLGRRTNLTRGNGTVTTYGYDAASRLSSLAHDLDGAATTNDVTTSFSYTPANQIATQTRSNDLYAWDGHYNVARGYTSNGMNQLTAAGATSLGYDARGNITSSGSDSFTYSSENLMIGATVAGITTSYDYDPMLRLYRNVFAFPLATRMQYDGTAMVATYNNAGAMLQRFVFGPGTDEPLVQYLGSGTGINARTFLHADERGSIVATSRESGAMAVINAYDEYGIHTSSVTSLFQYTGQMWMGGLGMYYYKARMYSPSLGRFMQSDPIGYGDGLNWHAYAGNDPVNKRDPSGLDQCHGGPYQGPCEPQHPENPKGYFDSNGQLGYYVDYGKGDVYFRGTGLDLNYFLGLGNSSFFQFGEMGQGAQRILSITFDKRCRAIPNIAKLLTNPVYYNQSLAMFNSAMASNPSIEYAFIADASSGTVGDLFTSNEERGIDISAWRGPNGEKVDPTGYYPNWVFTHPHTHSIGLLSEKDLRAATTLGLTMIAIDQTANAVCSDGGR